MPLTAVVSSTPRSHRRARRLLVAGLAAAVALVGQACAASGGAPRSNGSTGAGPPAGATVVQPGDGRVTGAGATTAEAAPQGAGNGQEGELPPFYRAPAGLDAAAAGDVLRSEPVDLGLGPSVRAWRLLYRSNGATGAPVAVSGIVLAPAAAPAQASPRPVLAFAHATTGLADRCAPSVRLTEGKPGGVERIQLTALAAITARGWVVTATDYEGLGTAGVHPYLVGASEGHSVLDSIRAAGRLEGTGAAAGSPTMVWGHSQGGGAALFAAEYAPSYAPELQLVGVVAGAPPAELVELTSAVLRGRNLGYGLLTAAAFAATYPEVDLSSVLTEQGREVATLATTACVDAVAERTSGQPASTFLRGDPTRTEPLATLLERNSPGQRPTPVPILVYHGEADDIVPPSVSASLVARMCRVGGITVHRVTYPGANHGTVLLNAIPDAMTWLADRLAGRPATSDCT